jgi:hypothetical protein
MEKEKTLEELDEEINCIEHKQAITEEDIKKAEKKLKEIQDKWIQDQKNK